MDLKDQHQPLTSNSVHLDELNQLVKSLEIELLARLLAFDEAQKGGYYQCSSHRYQLGNL